jgi:hypothetical protein
VGTRRVKWWRRATVEQTPHFGGDQLVGVRGAAAQCLGHAEHLVGIDHQRDIGAGLRSYGGGPVPKYSISRFRATGGSRAQSGRQFAACVAPAREGFGNSIRPQFPLGSAKRPPTAQGNYSPADRAERAIVHH